MRTAIVDILLMLSIGAVPSTSTLAQDYAAALGPLEVEGRITDGENKLANSEVVMYKEGEQVADITADKNGKFHAELEINANYSFEFRHEGFVPKRIIFNTHMPKPKPDEEIEMIPVVMDISLLEHARYEGANTDDLDFPFAMIKYNRKTFMFEQDVEYTMGMQRANGALLLMAARADMKR